MKPQNLLLALLLATFAAPAFAASPDFAGLKTIVAWFVGIGFVVIVPVMLSKKN